MPSAFVAIDTRCSGANLWPNHTEVQKVTPADRVILSQPRALGDGGYSTADVNDRVLAPGIAVAATIQSLVCTQETSRVDTSRVHIQSSSK